MTNRYIFIFLIFILSICSVLIYVIRPDICDTFSISCLYNFDPFKPHFYIVKLGFPGVYIIFLYLLKNIDCRRGGSNEYPQSMFRVPTIYVLSRNMKNIRIFYLKIFIFWW